MKAAVIASFDAPPRYVDIADPVPDGPDELLVDVLASGLHHVTRARASGKHYSSDTALPLIPGIDGVGRDANGRLRYFVQGPGMAGAMADKTVIDGSRSIVLPDDADPVAIAAAMNPAMASWLALRCRVPFQAGQSVLILGATGSSGSMAVQIARHLGAARIVAAGRDEGKLAQLPALGATDVVTLADPRLGALAADVDVVLDFLWGPAAVRCMEAVLRARKDRGRTLTWIHIGSMAGEAAAVSGMFLRAADLRIVGSGLGSVAEEDILRALPALVAEIARGTLRIDARAVPLRQVEEAWSDAAPGGARMVFTP